MRRPLLPFYKKIKIKVIVRALQYTRAHKCNTMKVPGAHSIECSIENDRMHWSAHTHICAVCAADFISHYKFNKCVLFQADYHMHTDELNGMQQKCLCSYYGSERERERLKRVIKIYIYILYGTKC